MLIDTLPNYSVTMQASDGQEFLNKLKFLQVPDIAIIDVHMPVLDGVETINALIREYPNVKSLALTFDGSNQTLIRCIKAGAKGFLLKNTGRDRLLEALNMISSGEVFQDPRPIETESGSLFQPGLKDLERKALLGSMSERELEFMRHVCSDNEHTYAQIAKKMNVHRRTVDNYRISLFNKFSIKSKAGLVLLGVRCGLVHSV